MAIAFPQNPTLNQTYTYNSITWTYNGIGWTKPGSASITVTPADISDQPNTSTGYFDLPSGTTAQRPASPQIGYTRYNTSLNIVEVYNGSAWGVVVPVTSYLIEYLVM